MTPGDEPLRVVLCTPAYAPAVEYGGPVVKVGALASGLQALGHDVEIWTSDFGLGRTRVAAGTRVVDGVRVRYHRRLAAYRWTPIAPAAFAAAGHVAADVVHCFGLRDGLTIPTALGFARAGRPYVVEPIGMHARRVRKMALKRVVDELLGDRYLAGAAAVIATSELERDELSSAVAPDRLHVRLNPLRLTATAPNAADTDAARRSFGIPTDAFVVGFAGRLSIKKGVDILLAAARQVPDVHVVVAGPEEDAAAVAELRAAAAGDLRGRLHVLPPVWNDGFTRLLRSFDVFALPSRTENFGNAAAEAVAAGVPVVVTDQCGIAATVTELDAGVVTTVDAASVAAAVRRLADDPDVRRRLSGKGDAIVRLLDPVTIAGRQADLYRQVLR